MNFPYDFQPYVKEEREAFHAEGRFHPQPWAHEPNAFWNEQQYPTYTNLNTNDVFNHQHFDFTSRVAPVLAPLHTTANPYSQTSSSLPSSSSGSDGVQFDDLYGVYGLTDNNRGNSKGQTSTYSTMNDWSTLPGTIDPNTLQYHQQYRALSGFGAPTSNTQIFYGSAPNFVEASQPDNPNLRITDTVLEGRPSRAAIALEEQSSGSSVTDPDDEESLSQPSSSAETGSENDSEYAEEPSPRRTLTTRTKPNVKYEIEGSPDDLSEAPSEPFTAQKTPRKRSRNEASTESEDDEESSRSSIRSSSMVQSRSEQSQKQVVPRRQGGRYNCDVFGLTIPKTTLYESTGQDVKVKIFVDAYAGFELRQSEDEEVYIFYRRNNLSLECSLKFSYPSSGADQKLYLKNSSNGVSTPVDYLYLRLVTRVGDENGETEEMKLFSSERKKLGAPSTQKIKPKMVENPLIYPESTGHGSTDPDTLAVWHPMRIQFGRATHCNNSKQKNQEHFVLAVELMARKVGGSEKNDVLICLSMWRPIQVRGRAPSHFRDEPAYWEKLFKSQKKTSRSKHLHITESDNENSVIEGSSDEAEEADDEDDKNDGEDTTQLSRQSRSPQPTKSRRTLRGKRADRNDRKLSERTSQKVTRMSREASIAKDYCAAIVRFSSSKVPWSSRSPWTLLKPGCSLPTEQIHKLLNIVKKGILKDNRDPKADRKVFEVAVDFVKTALSRKEQIKPRSRNDDESGSVQEEVSISKSDGASRKRTRQSS